MGISVSLGAKGFLLQSWSILLHPILGIVFPGGRQRSFYHP
jgi:hypothetical protein